MSRRRLERGFWNGRQVKITPKEYSRVFVYRPGRGSWYHRHEMMISMDWPFPDLIETDTRLPRKTKKAIWKYFNGHPETGPKDGVMAYNGWSAPGLLHKGRKP